jgi:hypothetical protein
MLRHCHNKHNGHHHGQKLLAWKAELRDDMGFGQIYLI